MKKHLAALAAMAACGAVSAQSSVTVFGVVDVAVSSVTNKAELVYTDPLLAIAFDPAVWLLPHSVKASRTELRNSGLSSSRLGFRGVEDLGGGLSAGFWLEAPITNDDGATGVSTFSRRSTVSLSGGFGELRLGRDNTPVKTSDDTFDPFGATGIGGSLIATAYSHSRNSNMVQYFLPRNLGGFYGNVAYGFSEKTSYSPLGPYERDSDAGRYFGARFGYANGPLDVALAYGQRDGLSGPDANNDFYDVLDTRRTKSKIFNLGATYDFGVAKLFAQYSQHRNERSTLPADYGFGLLAIDPKTKTQGYLLGVAVPVGAGVIRASIAQVKQDDNQQSLWYRTPDPKATKFALGYQHNLSKRTALYATVARVSNKNGMNLTVGGPNVMTAAAAVTLPAGVAYQAKNSTGYEFGLRHSF